MHKVLFLFFLFISTCQLGFTQIWSHTFETSGGYTTSHTECTDNSFDYFIRSNGTNISSDPTGQEGSFYFAAEDIDACGTSTATKTLLFNDLSIVGCSGLSLQVLAASIGNTNTDDNWDGGDYVHIEYQIDNSGTWNNAIWFESTGNNDEPAALDTDFNGVGNTPVLTNAFQNFTGTITGSGTLIDIRVVFRLDDGFEDIKLDNFRLFGTGCGANTITTGIVSGGPFTVDCATTDLGTVDFTSTGTFNVGNIFTAQLSNSAGSFASPINIGTISGAAAEGLNPGSTINITIPAATATGAGYRIRVISSNPATIGSDNGVNISITNGVCPNTINTGTITGGPFAVDCSTSDTGTIGFTSIGTFLGGNIYTAQLSNSAGSFAAPISIGTLTSIANSGTINITIPAGTATGAGYLIRIISSSPAVTGSSSASFTITLSGGPCVLTPPYMTSVIINSCNPTCTEGFNEIVFGNSGDYSFDVTASDFNFFYGTTSPGTNYTDVLVNNVGTISSLNTAAGCPGLFVNATGTTIPAGASWLLAYTDICTEALDWTGLCGAGPIYVILQDDPSWNTGGNFANSATSPGIRHWRTSITTTAGPTFTIDYTTSADNYPNSDGVYATFDPAGGAASAYGDDDCRLTPVLLPSTTVNFKVFNDKNTNLLFWQTQSEQNNDFFTVSHSTNGINYQEIGKIQGAGNSSSLINYSFTHERPSRGINYYKLSSTDYDGTTYNKGIVSVMVEGEGTYFDPYTSQLKFGEKSEYTIYSTDGKLLGSVNNDDSVDFQHHGMILIQDLRTLSIERIFVP